MPSRPKFYMAERVRELLENWARWPGWQSVGSSRSTLAWLDDFVANKRVGDYTSTIPVMGGEAATTHRALGRMPADLAEVLVAHYTWRGHVEEKLEKLNTHRAPEKQLSRRTFYRRVEEAHPVFIEQQRLVREEARAAEASNVRTSEHAAPSVARRHRLLVKPSMGLKKPDADENGP